MISLHLADAPPRPVYQLVGGPSYREAKGGALRPGRVAERWDKIPWFSRLVAVQCDSISTTPPSPGTSQRQRTGVSALHKPILRALHQSTLYWVAVNIAAGGPHQSGELNAGCL